MINNLQELKPGSLLFFKCKNRLISWWLSYKTKFKYSHVLVYLGKNEVLEDGWLGFGTRISTLTPYLNNDCIEGEVINPFQDPGDVKLFINRLKKLRRVCFSCKSILERALFNLGIEIAKKGDQISLEDIYKAVSSKTQ